MFPNNITCENIHRMDYQLHNGNQMNLPERSIPASFIKYESGTKTKERNGKVKKLQRPHKKGSVGKILLKTTKYCTDNSYLLPKKKKKKSKKQIDSEINKQINEMIIPKMSAFEASQHITSKSPIISESNKNIDQYSDIDTDSDESQKLFDEEIKQWAKKINQNNSPQSKRIDNKSSQPIPSHQTPTQSNNPMLQIPQSMMQQILDQNGILLKILQNQHNYGNNSLPQDFSNNSSNCNKINRNTNNSKQPPVPYPVGTMKRKIAIWKLLIDTKSKGSVEKRAKQLNPPLILKSGEINDVKLFFKFLDAANIVIDESEHETWTTKKFGKEMLKDTAIAKRYHKKKGKKLTLAKAIRWTEYVGKIADWTPPDDLVTLCEDNDTESNEMSVDEENE
eukprot:390435_1